MKTVEVPEKLGEYFENDTIETVDQAKDRWRKFLTDHHGDHGNGNEFTDLADMRGYKNDIEEALENGNDVRVETEAGTEPESQDDPEPVSEDLIEDSLQNGLNFYSVFNELDKGYDVINAKNAPEEIYATVSKDRSDLKIGLEIDPDGTEMNSEATYFADGFGEIETKSFTGDYGEIVEKASEDDLSEMEMFKRALEDTAAVTAKYAEEDIIPK
jgi:hypothetical protein